MNLPSEYKVYSLDGYFINGVMYLQPYFVQNKTLHVIDLDSFFSLAALYNTICLASPLDNILLVSSSGYLSRLLSDMTSVSHADSIPVWMKVLKNRHFISRERCLDRILSIITLLTSHPHFPEIAASLGSAMSVREVALHCRISVRCTYRYINEFASMLNLNGITDLRLFANRNMYAGGIVSADSESEHERRRALSDGLLFPLS